MSACTDPCGGYQVTGIPTATGQRSQCLVLIGQSGVLSQALNFNPNPKRGRDFTARVKGAVEPYEEIRG